MSDNILTKEEKDILLELLINEQLKHLIPKDRYKSNEYVVLEKLKSKIKNM